MCHKTGQNWKSIASSRALCSGNFYINIVVVGMSVSEEVQIENIVF